MSMYNAITDVAGIKVGHSTNLAGGTGCTVVLCLEGAVGGVDVRGSAPGTRETDLLRPGNLVEKVHGVLLSGGSAFGLDAASGVMRFLEEKGIGYKVGAVVVPIVVGAILFDLALITSKARPGPEDGYRACVGAHDGPVAQGTLGAGTGATVGKVRGMSRATKGGIGTASLQIVQGPVVGALVAVNAMGDVVDPNTGKVLAGPRREDRKGYLNTLDLLTEEPQPASQAGLPTNTTIGVVATDARLTKEQANKLAQVAHDGLAMAVRPAHTMGDGDLFFALATGRSQEPVDMNRLCAATVRVVSRAIVNAVLEAKALGGVPSARDVLGNEKL